MSEDLAHDAHLRAALRHAPDHALSPPSGLSQAILAAARQVHRPARATPAPPPMGRRAASAQRLRAWLRRLFAPRWAGAWAAGLVAALGLGLWLDLGLQPTIERPVAVTTGSAHPEGAAPAEEARAPTPRGGSAAGDARVAESSKAATPAPTRAPDNAPGPSRAAMRAEPRTADGAAAVRRSEVDAGVAQQRAAAGTSRDLAARRDSTALQPAAPPAVAAAPEASQPADQMAAPAAKAAAQSPEAHADESLARNAAGLRAAPHEARKSEVGDAVPAASPALTLLRRAQVELAAGSATWTWAAPGRVAMAPFDDAAQAWLWRVVQAARGRWVDVNERGDSLAALEVRWWRDGWPHATLRIEPDGLRWIEPSGRIRYAPLDPATLQRLRSF